MSVYAMCMQKNRPGNIEEFYDIDKSEELGRRAILGWFTPL